MATDIECYAEVRDTEGRWQKVKIRVFPYAYYDSTRSTKWACRDESYNDVETHSPTKHTRACIQINAAYTDRPITERNYDLFAILTGTVRNDDCWVGITSEPRGLPDDASEWIRLKAEDASSYAHSHSWLSLYEIRNYNWSAPSGNGDIPRESCQWFLERVLPRLESLISEGRSARDIRIVFWFDN